MTTTSIRSTAATLVLLASLPLTAAAQATLEITPFGAIAAALDINESIVASCMPVPPTETVSQHPDLEEIVTCMTESGAEVTDFAVNAAWLETQ
ncbi:MAG: hypothetical protein ABF248_08515 [Yoonia sp.]